jgi:hypothetical protein
LPSENAIFAGDFVLNAHVNSQATARRRRLLAANACANGGLEFHPEHRRELRIGRHPLGTLVAFYSGCAQNLPRAFETALGQLQYSARLNKEPWL